MPTPVLSDRSEVIHRVSIPNQTKTAIVVCILRWLSHHTHVEYIRKGNYFNTWIAGAYSQYFLCCIDADQLVESNYTFALTHDHHTYSPPSCQIFSEYYYEALQISVNESGFYTIFSSTENGGTNMPFDIYKHEFYAHVPSANLIGKNHVCYKDHSSQNTIELQTSIRYILVVTTCVPNRVGNFLIRVYGKHSVSFQRTSE